ncbi:hypothetical protein [Clostridium estertheticum]|uniref:hypothetical protein n=1 Tax=Clostridium estertheticum TaxID=238834 RepID=UPI001C0B0517|nr:hypothetical protein [Clostridium estertheticum]MBU3173336.1 hypothetical protein [Clostridium estertheticum]
MNNKTSNKFIQIKLKFNELQTECEKQKDLSIDNKIDKLEKAILDFEIHLENLEKVINDNL